jgi:crotonobetainyl-CoA:carnitine CoA-transferase CaiB-like acyl-CoA transferase
MKRILEGIRVIEWAQYWVGPFTASMLGDLGAEVIKLEPPIGDGMRHIRTLFGINLFLPGKREVYFEIANRNKKSVIINLKKQEGKDLLYNLRDREEWLQIFRQAEEFPYGIVADIEVLQHEPQVLENDYIIEFDHPVLGKTKFVGIPFKLTKTPASIRTPAPDLGEHTTEELSEVLGIKNTEISLLKKKEIIG